MTNYHQTPTELNWCKYQSISDIGKIRTNNEDRFLLQHWADHSGILAVVADGMGGTNAGDIAAQIAVDTFKELLEEPLPTELDKQYDILLKKCYEADTKIREKAVTSFQTLGMGTTIVAAIITPKTCVHVYAGDSRLYRFRNGQINYQTADHTLVRILVEIGRITPEDIPTHPMRSMLNSCLGGRNARGNFSVDPKWDEENQPIIEVQPDDLFLLSTDGLHSLVTNEQLEAIYLNYPECLLEQLVDTALNNGGRDNITALTIKV